MPAARSGSIGSRWIDHDQHRAARPRRSAVRHRHSTSCPPQADPSSETPPRGDIAAGHFPGNRLPDPSVIATRLSSRAPCLPERPVIPARGHPHHPVIPIAVSSRAERGICFAPPCCHSARPKQIPQRKHRHGVTSPRGTPLATVFPTRLSSQAPCHPERPVIPARGHPHHPVIPSGARDLLFCAVRSVVWPQPAGGWRLSPPSASGVRMTEELYAVDRISRLHKECRGRHTGRRSCPQETPGWT
jgi:hypothetical protein